VLEGVRLKVLLKQLVLDPGGVEVKVVGEVVQALHPLLLLHVGLLQVALHLVTCLLPVLLEAGLPGEVARVVDGLQLPENPPTRKNVHPANCQPHSSFSLSMNHKQIHSLQFTFVSCT